METVLTVSNIAVKYQLYHGTFRRSEFWALKDISFDLYKGECLGVIGRNGVGKSTLLSVLAGIIKPDRGSVTPRDRSATLLSLQLGFMSHLNGRENAIISGMLLGLRRKEILASMDEIERFAELGDFFYQPLHTYSSGMKARLGFSVAITSDPEIMLLDEVLGVGDDDFRKKSASAIAQKIKSDRTVILVSHQLSQIQTLCNRVLWVEQGYVQEIGEPHPVIDRYVNHCNRQLLAGQTV